VKDAADDQSATGTPFTPASLPFLKTLCQAKKSRQLKVYAAGDAAKVAPPRIDLSRLDCGDPTLTQLSARRKCPLANPCLLPHAFDDLSECQL